MKRTTAIVHISTIIMLATVLFVGNSVANKYSGVIDLYLSKSTTNYDTTEAENALAEGKDLATEFVENGAVLLKNDNNTLPLKQPNINIFGWSGCDNGFLYQGGGSSEGGYSADKVSLYQSFRNAGFKINEDLATSYNNLSYRREGSPDSDQFSVYYRLYEPGQDFYTDSLMTEAKSFSDTALIVLSRRATEGDDLPKCQYDENGNEDDSRNYLALSDKEATLVGEVTANFDKVIVLFDTSAPMEMGFLDYDGIDSALYVGYPGYYGATAIAEILDGEVNPSGHMVDTAAYDLTTAPSYANSSNDASRTYANRGGHYMDYAESIYVGYKWYETADAEGYWNGASLNSYGHAKSGYNAVVQYPYGYGKSYTTFDWSLTSVTLGDGTALIAGESLPSDAKVIYTVWVENTGSVAGKDVVQLYYSAPYTSGGIEKSAVNLIDFQKTASLDPGKGEALTLTCRVSDMASYDAYDSNNNGFMGYELDGGNYALSLRTDSHTVKTINSKAASYTYKIPAEGYKYTTDADTGSIVKNRFTTYTNSISGASSTIDEPEATYAISIDGNDSNASYNQGITYLSRSNFSKTFPQVTATRSMDKTMYDNVFKVHSPAIDASDVMPTTGSTATSYTLTDMMGLAYDDAKWTSLIEQLTPTQMANLSAGGGFGTIAIAGIGKPATTDSDGGTGFTSSIATGDSGHATKYPAAEIVAQTFDWKEAYKWGHAIGTEGQALGIQGWYAPGCNVHRSPLGGRNFEYFSEDGRMCGIMVGWTVKGATENGVYCYMKHFAGNDTDAGRNGQFRWMTEQALREEFAKPGEIATKIGGANASMISVDRVGSVRATGSYALLTSLLRNEWGFRGATISDYYQGGNVNDIDEGIRAGNDLALEPGGTASLFDDYASATSVIALQKAAHNILYMYVDTVYRTKTATGVDLNSTVGTKTSTTSGGTWWRPTLIAVDVGAGLGLGTWATLCIIFTWVKKKHD
jgi:beta-glucosidase